jgi:uncharacterized membrane protein YdbT with pleckstrin-like domain
MSREPEVIFHRLHPATIAVRFMGIARQFLLPGLVVLFLGKGIFLELALMWLTIPATIWAVIKFFSMQYALTPTHLILKEGITGRSERRIPLIKIQAFETQRTLVHKLFAVDDVIVHTGSGGEAEATLSVLHQDTTAQLRRHHQQKHQNNRSSDEAAILPATEVRASVKELVFHGLAYNEGMVVVLVLLGILWQMDLFSWDTVENLWQSLPGFSQVAEEWIFFKVPIYLVLGWILMRIFSVVWSLVTYHDFKLFDEREQIRLDFGLIFHRDQTLPKQRFHIVQIEEKPIHRWRKAVTLKAWTASTWANDEDTEDLDDLFKSMVVHPFIQRDQARTLIARILGEPDWENPDWQGLDPRAFKRVLLRYSLLYLCALPFLAVQSLWLLLLTPLLLAAAWWNAHVRIRHTHYAVTEQGVWLRTGYFVKRWRLVGLNHIQVVESLASPFDRRKQLAGVLIDAPSAPGGMHALRIPYLAEETAEALRNNLGRIAARRSMSW